MSAFDGVAMVLPASAVRTLVDAAFVAKGLEQDSLARKVVIEKAIENVRFNHPRFFKASSSKPDKLSRRGRCGLC